MARVDIKIRDRVYSMTCAPGQNGWLRALAHDLDQRIEKIVETTGDIGNDRLLLMASLALLDELSAAHRKNRESVTQVDIEQAARALNGAATRIEAICTRIKVK